MVESEKLLIKKHTNAIYNKYRKRTKKSRKVYERAKNFLPGGNSRTTIFWKPYPVYFQRGEGFTVYDLDGNEYLDFIGNYTSLIHGHTHPEIVEAIQAKVESGTSVHLPTEDEVQLAEQLCERFPSVDKIRFTNSGTEATINALRLARAYTGKDKILKAEGAYHGTHLPAEVSFNPDLSRIGPIDNPLSVPELGTPTSIANDVIIYPFNHRDVTERLIKKYRKELAAVIVEPVMRTIPPEDDYLPFLREITSENNIVLIFDEVICARISRGGAQEYYGVTPDLTALGKLFGGGLPFGAFGGKDDIMRVSDPSKKESIGHGGTFNANPLTMAAGIVATEMLTTEAINRINSLGELQRGGVNKVLDELGIIAQITGVGSLMTIHLTDEHVKDFRTSAKAKKSLNHPLYISLLNNGITIASRIFTALSTPMTSREIEVFIEAYRHSMEKMKTLFKEVCPNLMA